MNSSGINSRKIAFDALQMIHKQSTYADIALDRILNSKQNSKENSQQISQSDRALITELVYGVTRRQRTLDALIEKFTGRDIAKQTLGLRLILQIGIYQICYLDHIPVSAAVNTSVDLAKLEKLEGLAGLVNGVLRSLCRSQEKNAVFQDIEDLGRLHSFPDWLIQFWIEQFGADAASHLCQWFNRSPHIDLRVNLLKVTRDQVLETFEQSGISAQSLPNIPTAIRLGLGSGSIPNLPGFTEGWWSVQDASAQLAAYLLDPQPNQLIIDACAAPGGKTTHIAELMQDQGTIYACDRTASRLKKVKQNCDRLGLTSIQTLVGDSREFTDFKDKADRVLLDVPCSGLGTLHRHADARWRQNVDEPSKLAIVQTELINQAATWVKEGGSLVYATCTLHPTENEEVITNFLSDHPNWQLAIPDTTNPAANYLNSQNWIKILPHEHDMDGFFMAKLIKISDTPLPVKD